MKFFRAVIIILILSGCTNPSNENKLNDSKSKIDIIRNGWAIEEDAE